MERKACKRRNGCLLGLLVVLGSACAGAQGSETTPPGNAADVAELRRITQEMMDAIAPGKAEVWERYLHERLIHVDENGVVRGKSELVRELEPLPPGLVGRIEVDVFKAEIHGDVAVVARELQEYLDYHGQPLRTRFRNIDTWLRTPQGWRLIAEQTAAVLKDPPAVALTREQLCAYEGTYSLTVDIVATVRCVDGGLLVERTGRPAAKYLPEAADLFFTPGQPRSRRVFLRDQKGAIVGFADRREGEDIRWTRK
jgi:hypothetical protein